MTLSVISFTGNGERLSRCLAKKCTDFPVERYSKRKPAQETENSDVGDVCTDVEKLTYVKEHLNDWARAQFEKKRAILFIGACGIAVRAIAPSIRDKCTDSPVLVMDEQGAYVIPILSGHIGGANELAYVIAERMGATPVITTATDLNQKFAVDIFAKKNGLWIRNREGIAQVSAKILREEEITISVGAEHCRASETLPKLVRLVPFPPTGEADVLIAEEPGAYAAKLLLTPKNYVLGIGCRKGTTEEQLLSFITEQLERLGISFSQVGAVASIDLKKEEPGLKQFTLHAGIPFVTYAQEELAAVEGEFHESEFVRETVGIGNVCERAALRACAGDAGIVPKKETQPNGAPAPQKAAQPNGAPASKAAAQPGGKLVLEKTAQDGMTLAVAKRAWEVTFDGC